MNLVCSAEECRLYPVNSEKLLNIFKKESDQKMRNSLCQQCEECLVVTKSRDQLRGWCRDADTRV